MREALLDRYVRTGKRSPRLDAVKVPAGFEYLFSLFWELRSGASEGLGGVRITWRDIADYQAVMGIALDAFEVEAVMEMDHATAGAIAEANDG
jgi:hypothetical protein